MKTFLMREDLSVRKNRISQNPFLGFLWRAVGKTVMNAPCQGAGVSFCHMVGRFWLHRGPLGVKPANKGTEFYHRPIFGFNNTGGI